VDFPEGSICKRGKVNAIPIINYNLRNRNLTTAALKERGYAQIEWPYAPCGILTRPNDFD